MNVSEKLRTLRERYDLTQAQLAKIAGVSDKAISTWESGTRSPKLAAIQNICSHFNLDLNRFIDDATSFDGEQWPTPVSESEPHVNIVKIAGRDGSFVEKRLSDKQLQALKSFVDLLPDASDDL